MAGEPTTPPRRPREGLDVRGDGGYVVAPPSRHGSGRVYRWVGWEAATAAAIDDVDDLWPMPPWLVEFVTARPAVAPQR